MSRCALVVAVVVWIAGTMIPAAAEDRPNVIEVRVPKGLAVSGGPIQVRTQTGFAVRGGDIRVSLQGALVLRGGDISVRLNQGFTFGRGMLRVPARDFTPRRLP